MFSLGVWRCRKYSNLYSPRFFVRITRLLRAVATKLLIL
nr:MAG TPA: hypothetical protein [Caudoviricetes sp.]DAL10064.1 MAG TPA_asm: hypothetical protein [Caudoviricetes sp.]